MIYTIGYQHLTGPDVLSAILDIIAAENGVESAKLVDVRTNPVSRKRGFSRKALTETLGGAYEWRGDVLGGKGSGPTSDAIHELRRRNRAGEVLLLMCLEDKPGQCHRHHDIATRLEPGTCLHIYHDELIEARELERANQEGGGYECLIHDWLEPVAAE